MKNILALFAMIGISGVTYAADEHKDHHAGHAKTAAPATGTMNQTANGKTVSMAVEGMTCGSCAQKVKTEFKNSGYECAVDLETNKVTVNLKDGQTITDAQLQTIVKKAGFTPGTINR